MLSLRNWKQYKKGGRRVITIPLRQNEIWRKGLSPSITPGERLRAPGESLTMYSRNGQSPARFQNQFSPLKRFGEIVSGCRGCYRVWSLLPPMERRGV